MRLSPQRRAWTLATLAAALALLPACSVPTSATSGPAGVSTDGVAIAHVDHRYIAAQDFVRISEYFTDKENTSGRVILRTDPAERAGYYFIVSLEWHPGTTLPAGTQADLDYVRSDDPEPRHAHFVFTEPTGTLPEILLGLTGKDWAEKNLKLAAYKVTLKNAEGQVLADKQSFLWGLPPEPKTATPAPAKP
jgi:hypothetical protein